MLWNKQEHKFSRVGFTNTPVPRALSISIEGKCDYFSIMLYASTSHVSIPNKKSHWLQSRTPDGAKNVFRSRRLVVLCNRRYT